MDHKVSKDMISSGMTPSGEKTQADLGRTQYGSAPSPSRLMDAYKSMYEHHQKDKDGNTIPHEGENVNEEPITGTLALIGAKLAAGAAKAGAVAAKAAPMLGKAGKVAVKVAKSPQYKAVKDIARTGEQISNTVNTVKSVLPQSQRQQPAGTPGNPIKAGVRSAQYAGVDLFDIVKGQLLDEGLSEEEIRDIMLELTPDEILNEMGKATPEAGTGKYYDEKNPTPKQKEIQKNLPQNRKPTPEQQAARDKYAKIRDMTNKGDHQGASKLYNS